MRIIRKRGRRGKEQKEVKKKKTYPDSLVLYDPDTLIGQLFLTREDIEEALESGKWIKFPFMKLEDWLKFREEEKNTNS